MLIGFDELFFQKKPEEKPNEKSEPGARFLSLSERRTIVALADGIFFPFPRGMTVPLMEGNPCLSRKEKRFVSAVTLAEEKKRSVFSHNFFCPKPKKNRGKWKSQKNREKTSKKPQARAKKKERVSIARHAAAIKSAPSDRYQPTPNDLWKAAEEALVD
jgi:hypothetical protein